MRRGCLWLLLVLSLLLAGCTGGNGTEQEETMENKLNQRQIRILESHGLPTEYEELTTSQCSAIFAIEALLVQLETKYNEEFDYIRYTPGEGAVREHLVAYPVSAGREMEVILYRWAQNGQVQYEDTYNLAKAKPLYSAAVEQFAAEQLDPENYRLFLRFYGAKENADQGQVLKNVSAKTYLFVNGAYVSQEQCEALGPVWENWLKENFGGLSCGVLVARIRDAEFRTLTQDTYSDMLRRKEPFGLRLDYLIREDGTMRASRWEADVNDG